MKRIVLVILITSIVVLGIITALMIHVFGYVTVNKNYVMPLKLPLHNIMINNDVGNVVITQSQNPKLIIHIMAEGFFLSGNICTLLYGEVNGTLLVTLRLNQPYLGLNTFYNFTIYVGLPTVMLNNVNVTVDNGNIKIENINFKNADITVNNGNVEIENINSTNIYLNDINGNVRLINTNTSVIKLNSVNGNIKAEDVYFFHGLIKTLNGNLELKNAIGNYLKASTTNGNIFVIVNKYFNLTYYLTTRNGDIEITALPSIRIVTYSGVTYPPPVIYANTTNGNVDVNTI